jgi:hypothetical protein
MESDMAWKIALSFHSSTSCGKDGVYKSVWPVNIAADEIITAHRLSFILLLLLYEK